MPASKACYAAPMSETNDRAGEERYEPAILEPKWQAIWEERRSFVATRTPGKPKFYGLDMFPYPSGSGLHVGHPEGYTATDIVCRYKRMRGCDVLHPMGWDAFGLPAEQHAIQTGTHPRDTTASNIATFKRQLKSLGFSYDWTREVDTTDADYVRWTQWIFLKLFQRGLAFQSEVPVNWCPELGTVLANEEVIDGKSERGQHPVVRLPLRQWMLRITAYADRLDAELEGLDWPETKGKQRHWIGRSEGAEIDFSIEGHDATMTVFTTRPDTVSGVTYVVLAPEHPLVAAITTEGQRDAVNAYIEVTKSKSDIERTDLGKTKTGVATGAFAVNPINGDKVSVWVGDYVLAHYGTGAVMAVPAHDERDHAFAKTYGLGIVPVVRRTDGKAHDFDASAFTDDGESTVLRSHANVGEGVASAEVRKQTVAWLNGAGKGRAKVTYRLRDWVFSRQRYWGEPIPIYFPVDCDGDPRLDGAEFKVRFDKPIAVPESELPLRLPELEDYRPGQDPAGPLARARDWRFFQQDGQLFARETNTMPQWAGSCWYYLRYVDPRNVEEIFSQDAYDAWMPVDLYVGGSEHAVLHLLYARFWHKALFDIGVVKHAEPFVKLVHQGMILGENGEKMSKSRGNVINPDDVVKSHGADSLRVYEMFMGPLEAVKPWQTNGVEGVRRFLDRVWNLGVAARKSTSNDVDTETLRAVHKTIKKVTEDIDGLRFNTAVSAMMILVKQLQALPSVPQAAVEPLVLLLAPFAPHIAEELWERFGHADSLTCAPWPTFDAALCEDAEIEIGVQVNGKARSVLKLAKDESQASAVEKALEDAKVKAHTDGKAIVKIVYVPGRILNLIVK